MEKNTPAPAVSASPPPFRSTSTLHKMLVKEIQAMEFVEMCLLLLDDQAPAERLKALPQHIRKAARNSEQREISSLCRWRASFVTMAVVSQLSPDRVVEMLAHMRLIIKKAHRHGGTVKPPKADPP